MGRRVGSTHKPAPGKRVTIYLPNHSLAIAKQIDNLSEFFQVSLEQAAGIMAFDIIKKETGIVDKRTPSEEQLDTWNKNHPLDPLTAKRLGKQNGTTPKSISRNPVIDN
jgi:hypothetical protein